MTFSISIVATILLVCGAVAASAKLVNVGQADEFVSEFVMRKVQEAESAGLGDEELPLLVHLATRFSREALRAERLDKEAHAHALVFGLIDAAAAGENELRASLLPHIGAELVQIKRCFWISPLCTVQVRAHAARGFLSALAELKEVVHAVYWNGKHRQPLLEEPVESDGVALQPQGVQWNVEMVSAPELWSEGVTGEGASVAICDTGVEWSHPLLVTHYRGSTLSANGTFESVSHDYNWFDGAVDDPANSPAPFADGGHGTHCTGTAVGGTPDNAIGAAPGAKWIACRNMLNGFGTPSSYVACLQFITAPTKTDGSDPRPDLRPTTSSHSYGCPAQEGCSAGSLHDAVKNVAEAGVHLVVAAGNEGPLCKTAADPPGIFAEVTTVGATKKNSVEVVSFSSRGPPPSDETLIKPDVVAPGSMILSAYPGNTTRQLSGTSMATPLVAGIIALQQSASPTLIRDIAQTNCHLYGTTQPRPSDYCSLKDDSSAVLDAMMHSIDDTAEMCSQPSKNNNAGNGFVDAFRAVHEKI